MYNGKLAFLLNYQSNWKIKLSFKWIIIKKRFNLGAMNFYTILQILSVALLKNSPLSQILATLHNNNQRPMAYNQLKLFIF